MSEQVFVTERKIEIINHEQFAKSFHEYLEGKRHVAELSGRDFMIRAYETLPLEGYEPNPEFPNCCEGHAQMLARAKSRLDEFPGCCEIHKKLAGQIWFDKMDYVYMPEKVVNTTAYTLHVMKICSQNKNWFKEITDYINYTMDGYGQFPYGYGNPIGLTTYLGYLEANISNIKELSIKQGEQLLDFIENILHPSIKEKSTDLNQLIGIYKEWLKIFPFEVSYLSHLKSYYQNRIPILRGPVDTNIYTGLTSYKIISKKKLVKFLKDSTDSIITQVNALEVFKAGGLNNRTQTKIELLNARRKIEINTLTIAKESEKAYIKTLKSWLKQEKIYIEELSYFLKDDYSTETFILNIIDGMKRLQAGDNNQPCIVSVRDNGTNKESGIRNWFSDFLYAKYHDCVVTAEEEHGPGMIDLKIYHKFLGTKVIEFKGWWNQDKGGVTKQVINYLTDFEPEGFVFIINHLKSKDVVDDYCKLVTNTNNGYVDGSWLRQPVPNSEIAYFISKHHSATSLKTVYHFIFNVNF